MSILKKMADKLYLKQWGIGFIRQDIKTMIREKNSRPSITWMDAPDKSISSADPFLLKTAVGEIHLFFERMTSFRMDGTIRLMVLDDQLCTVDEKELLATGTHLSYPFVIRENGKTFIIPENALGGKLIMYEYDDEARTLNNPLVLLDIPVLDATILAHGGKYWLFCTPLGPAVHQSLLIYSATDLRGPYKAHAGNPVKNSLYGSRPAGAIIEVDGELYRPTQNCTNYYGESLVINKIKTLSDSEYSEEFYMELKGQIGKDFSYGIHHIHSVDNLVVVDGQRNHFEPIRQLLRKLRKSF